MKAFKQEENVARAIEFGPGGVLTKLLKRIEPDIERVQVSDKLSLESCPV
jgi:malonyl CoA-acyl carrier protein transacylase